MKSLPLALLTLLFSVAAGAATISGTVTGDSSQPLGSMTVAAYTAAGLLQSSGSTTSSGTYSLTVPAGTYHVLAFDPAGAFATSFYADADSYDTSASLALTSAQNATNINFRLVHAGFAVGHVSGPSGTGLANITVAAYNLSGTRRGFTTTDAAGSFTLALPPGSYKIAGYDAALAYVTTFFNNATSFDTASSISIASTASTTANLQLPLAAKLTGLVSDRATLAPIANARVTVYAGDGSISSRMFTGGDGRYAIAQAPGGLRVVVDDPAGNYATTYVPDAESFSAEPQVGAAAGQAVTIDATMVRAGHLAGRVTDSASGTPLAGITAVAYNDDGTTRAFAATDANGLYSIVVPPADYRLGTFDAALVYLPRFYANQALFAGAAIAHAVTQQTINGFDFTLSKGARVTGHVTSRSLGTALNAMTVGAYDPGGQLLASASSDASGLYTLLLPPATVKLLAFDSSLQFATAYYLDAPTFDTTQSLALVEGQSLTADFTMSEAGRISGVVIADGTFAPLASIDVIVYDTSFRTILETTTDSGGSFRVAVPPGTYLVAVADATHHYTSAFYSGGSGSMINVSAHQDVGPLQFRLSTAVTPSRRRAVRQ
ncbi:MAG TPA: carboxypeptidase-like regulatory domain-containing protein [Thermoanaerobaculia bacterium]|nr:carboxypeptidase-like regulatory domain-containing protein [Thermoanaerobaculia bacterium]